MQGLEAGLLVGVILCALHFAYEYSLMQLVSLTVLPSRSHAMLPFRYQQILALFKDHITAVSVSGTELITCLCCVPFWSPQLAEHDFANACTVAACSCATQEAARKHPWRHQSARACLNSRATVVGQVVICTRSRPQHRSGDHDQDVHI